MQIESGDYIVFVCYESNKNNGLNEVAGVANHFEEVKNFLKETIKDHISRSVTPFKMNYIGSGFSREIPPGIYLELEAIESHIYETENL